MNIKWNKAPVKTVWGDDMVVASVAIDNDHTVDFYCERSQTAKVEAMFAPQRKLPSTEEIKNVVRATKSLTNGDAWAVAEEITNLLYIHGIKENT